MEALQRISYTEYLLDILLYGEIEEKAALIAAQAVSYTHLDGVLFFAPEALFHELHPEIASFDYSWSIVNDPKKRTMWELN